MEIEPRRFRDAKRHIHRREASDQFGSVAAVMRQPLAPSLNAFNTPHAAAAGGGLLALGNLIGHAEHAAKAAVFACLCSASLLATPAPTVAAAPSLDQSIVQFSEAIHPILALQNTAFPPFTEQVAALVFSSIEPEKLARSIEVSLDALTSVPSEKITTFNGVLKDQFGGETVESGCPVVPLPPKDLVSKIA